MSESASLFLHEQSDDASLLRQLLDDAPIVFVKKLSKNDRDWARFPNKHQAGVYIPPGQRDSGFFPALSEKDRSKSRGSRAGSSVIREVEFETDWPQSGEVKNSRLVHYTSKGSETHLTGVPKSVFRPLAPASFIVIGKMQQASNKANYRCITIDSDSLAAEVLADLLPIEADFKVGLFRPAEEKRKSIEYALTFVEEVLASFRNGQLAGLSSRHATLPSTEKLAEMARNKYLKENGLKDINPYNLDCPGDVLRQISRVIEFELFKSLQLKAKSLELIRLIVGDDPKVASVEKVIRKLVSDYHNIDALLLSAGQQRKSRAGYSFEYHIERMLGDGKIPYDKQVVLDAKKRPDFILPSKRVYQENKIKKHEALVLSAKTTLRERWKQVQREINDSDLYLATVDENIASNAIEDMSSLGIYLVVPESLKNSKETEYKNHSNVLSFKAFFNEVRKARMPVWRLIPEIQKSLL